MANSNLHKAKTAKKDEFYTLLNEVARELMHYKEHFRGKTVLCNCDDPTWSAFWGYFHLNFSHLGLRKLISTHYDATAQTYKMEYEGGDDNDIEVGVITPLEGNGDFRNEECIELLKEADIVVTNPPFSLFREYVAQLVEHEKDFILIGNTNAVTYKEIFPLIRDGKLFPGYSFNKTMEFIMPDDYELKGKGYIDDNGRKRGFVPAIAWFTSLDIQKHHEKLILWKEYSPEDYPMYDNYDAINVDKVADIPVDYDGVMGVPITFLDKYNPDQFEIIGLAPERLSPDEASLQIKRYENAIQHKRDGSTCSGGKVNDGPTILHSTVPQKYPYYTSDTVPGAYLEVLYARILIRRKDY